MPPINARGAATTAVVLAVVVATKFLHGAWVVIAAVPVAVTAMTMVHRHYQQVHLRLRAVDAEPQPPHTNHVLVLLDRVDEATARAVSYHHAVRPASLRALAWRTYGNDVEQRWQRLAPDVRLEVVPPEGTGAVRALKAAVADEVVRHPDAFTTAIIPETFSRSLMELVSKHRTARELSSALLSDGHVIVADLTSPMGGPGPYTLEEPAKHRVVVLVSRIDKGALRALAYARTLHAATVRALHVNVDPDRARSLLREWTDRSLDVPLELIDSPFRHLADAVTRYVADLRPDGRRTVVMCILPEFRLPHWYRQPLHAQTALAIKARLPLQRGVITTSVPLSLSRYQGADSADRADSAITPLTASEVTPPTRSLP